MLKKFLRATRRHPLKLCLLPTESDLFYNMGFSLNDKEVEIIKKSQCVRDKISLRTTLCVIVEFL